MSKDEINDILKQLIDNLEDIYTITVKLDDKIFINIYNFFLSENEFATIESHVLKCKKENNKYLINKTYFRDFIQELNFEIYKGNIKGNSKNVYSKSFVKLYNEHNKNDETKEYVIELIQKMIDILIKNDVKFY